MVLDIAAYIVGVYTGRLDKIHMDGWIWMTRAYSKGDVHTVYHRSYSTSKFCCLLVINSTFNDPEILYTPMTSYTYPKFFYTPVTSYSYLD